MRIGVDRWRNKEWLLGLRASQEQVNRWGLNKPISVAPTPPEVKAQGAFYPSVLAWPMLQMINQEKQI